MIRFGLADSSGLLQAFVPAIAPAPSSWRHIRPARAVSFLYEKARSEPLEPNWPWVFEQPGRRADLPAEEVFSGFEGLMLDELDELDDTSNQDDGYSSKVRPFPYAMPRIRHEYRVRLAEKAGTLPLFPVNNQDDQLQCSRKYHTSKYSEYEL